MQFLATLWAQLKGLWSRWSPGQRIGLTAAAVACIVLVGGTLMWATRTEYLIVRSNLNPQESAKAAGILDTEQIGWQMNFSGSAISVARRDVSRARMALAREFESEEDGDGGSSGMGSELFPTPNQEEERRRRQREQRLARSISQIRGVRSATVHISQPMPSPFFVEKTPVTASVIVTPTANSMFTTRTAQSIIMLVAGAVEGLTPENVSLLDNEGRPYATQPGSNNSMGSQLEYQQQIESALSLKAEAMLSELLGPGRAVVKVTADIDFRDSRLTEKRYDPDQKVATKETLNTETQPGGRRVPDGPVGAAANSGADVSANASSGPSTKKIVTTEYITPETTAVYHDLPGKIVRLTIAAIVDLSAAAGTGADGSANGDAADTGGEEEEGTLTGPDQTEVENIIKLAVGFDAERNDAMQLMVARLVPDEVLTDAPLTGSFWQTNETLLQSVSLCVAAVVALVICLLVIRRLKPVVVTVAPEDAMSVADMRRLQTIAEQARANPEVVASILAAWLGESEREAPEAAPVASGPGMRRAA